MRLIDADKLAEAVKEMVGLETGIGREINDGMVVAYAMIAMAPTLTLDDMRPKGRWTVQDESYTKFQCSRCECKNFGQRWNFCPACGADMQGGGEDA